MTILAYVCLVRIHVQEVGQRATGRNVSNYCRHVRSLTIHAALREVTTSIIQDGQRLVTLVVIPGAACTALTARSARARIERVNCIAILTYSDVKLPLYSREVRARPGHQDCYIIVPV